MNTINFGRFGRFGRFGVIVVLIALLFTSCAPAATATQSPEIQTQIADQLSVPPEATFVASTDAPTASPVPTDIPVTDAPTEFPATETSVTTINTPAYTGEISSYNEAVYLPFHTEVITCDFSYNGYTYSYKAKAHSAYDVDLKCGIADGKQDVTIAQVDWVGNEFESAGFYPSYADHELVIGTGGTDSPYYTTVYLLGTESHAYYVTVGLDTPVIALITVPDEYLQVVMTVTVSQ